MSPHQRVLTAAALTVKSRRIRSARAVAAGSGDLGPLPRARCAAVAVGVRVARLGGRGGWHRRWGPPMLTGLANSISLLANVMSLGERRRPSMPRAGLTSQRVGQGAGAAAAAGGGACAAAGGGGGSGAGPPPGRGGPAEAPAATGSSPWPTPTAPTPPPTPA